MSTTATPVIATDAAAAAIAALDTCYALLDDSGSTAQAPRSRLYTQWRRSLRCDSAAQLPAVLSEMQAALADGLHAVAVFDYELGNDLHGLPGVAGTSQILLFAQCQLLGAADVAAMLHAHAAPGPAGITTVDGNVDETQFATAINKIHAYIEGGDTYQVNYTVRLRFDTFGDPLALYARLRARQPVPYGAFIALPDGRTVLSLSPELFVRHADGVMTARPMKGTAPAAADGPNSEAENAQRAAALAQDPKNRAENLMIVDLLRNDLGRVARDGSVRVPALFEVQRYGQVLQMTSTVQAQLGDQATLAGILAALYPCGSITGAPKRRTMEIIREIEPDPRGLYTGAIGWFDAPKPQEQLGAFCLSVPIRTVVLQPLKRGVRRGEMGVGAGIVFDSEARQEYAECRLKARFLTGLTNDFEIFETIYATRDDGCRHLPRHLARLRESAGYFRFTYDAPAIARALDETCAKLAVEAPHGHRLRLALRHDGTIAIQPAPLAPLSEPVKVLLAPQTTMSGDLFLRHKTSVRAGYDAAWRAAEQHGAFDMLFFNEDGALTEGGRCNVFIELDGRWYTPPLACGVLPGVMRAVLLADPAWQAAERRLTLADLREASRVVICNALRGALPATILWD